MMSRLAVDPGREGGGRVKIGIEGVGPDSVSIIVPTYREAKNLPLLLPRVLSVMAAHGVAGEVIVVDDDSGDGTQELCQPFVEAGQVRLEVRRGERGLSSAVLRGIELGRCATVVVMDADLSHPPESIPDLLSALEDGADMALGSRYITGGSTADEWTTWRWINSKAATLLARPFTSANDPMAGFFAVRRSDVQAAWDSLNPLGYKIALELIVKCGFKRIDEVPIRFENRSHGQSKLNLREQFNYLRHVFRLYRYCLARRLKGAAGPEPSTASQTAAPPEDRK